MLGGMEDEAFVKKLPRRPPLPVGPDQLTPMQEKVLGRKRRQPMESFAAAARAVGVAPDRVHRWSEAARHPERAKPRAHLTGRNFLRMWNQIERAAKEVHPPDPGPFKTWREQYVNVPSSHPISGREVMVGVTHPYMVEICDALDDPAITNLCIVIPVGLGKTTLIEQKIVHDLCEDPQSRIVFFGRTRQQLMDRATMIKRPLQDTDMYPELHEKWGPWIGKPDGTIFPWTATSFYIRGRKDPQRAPSFSGYTLGASSYGARARKIYLDDLDDPSFSIDRRWQIVQKIRGEIQSRKDMGSQLKVVYIGTYCGPGSVVSHLRKMPGWTTIWLSGVKEDGTPLAPEMHTPAEVEQLRLMMGEQMFSMMYLNDEDADAGGTMFPPALLDTCKGMFGLNEAPSDWKRILTFDPAASERAAGMVLAYSPTGEIRVLDLEIVAKASFESQFAAIQRLTYRNKPGVAVIESQGGSAKLEQYPAIERFLWNEGCTRIVPFRTSGTNKHDPLVGIKLVKALMERDRLRIAWGSPEAQTRMAPLVADLVAWQPKPSRTHRYDAVMALWIGVNHINEQVVAASRPRERVPDPIAARYIMR